MATSSILRNVTIKGRVQCRKLVKALEQSSSSQGKSVTMQKTVHTMTRSQIREIFGDKNA